MTTTRKADHHHSSVCNTQLTNVSFASEVHLIHHLQQLYLNDCLVVERLLVLNDLYGNVFLVDTVKCLHNLLTPATSSSLITKQQHRVRFIITGTFVNFHVLVNCYILCTVLIIFCNSLHYYLYFSTGVRELV